MTSTFQAPSETGPTTRRVAAVLLAVALAGASVALSGCSADPALSSVTAATSAPAADSALPPADFAAAAKMPGTTVLDVRTPSEFAAGHLPGAVNIDLSAADFEARITALDKRAPYAVYCHSGNRSAAALQLLDAAGFTAAYHLAGGISAWTAAGGEVVTR